MKVILTGQMPNLQRNCSGPVIFNQTKHERLGAVDEAGSADK